jgi:putative heme-binding domain-containing protein
MGNRVIAEQATPVSSIRSPKGFKVELLRSARKGESSWISMTFDHRGRIIVGLDDVGVGRLTLAKSGAGVQFERIENSLKHCRGVLYAHDSLYVSATNTPGLYRLRDTNGDDQFDKSRQLKKLDYRSRYGHGSNQIVLGPDKQIYWVIGNDVAFPKGVSPNSPYREQRNDWLNTFSADIGHDFRVGFILRSDKEGEKWKVLAGGLRNQVDLAFNSDGEMFTYDADMEWDVGMPWYRPTRLLHVVSGADYGWRWSTGKWPAHYADSLPAILDTGLGSPTALTFGTDSKFPPSYQRGLFMADWQNGRILLVHMLPAGSSYECDYELFLEGGPLNVCDMQFGPDGALYFITGGRGSQSGLYRVSYIGKEESKSAVSLTEVEFIYAAMRNARRGLEAFHTRADAKAIELAWPHLRSNDRWLQHAARLAIERQPVEQWRERALTEKNDAARVTALIALARIGGADDQPALLESLGEVQLEKLTRATLLAALRVCALSFIRQGRPNDETCRRIAKRLNDMYPHENGSVNRELCELLVYLRWPGIIEKTLARMKPPTSQEQQIHYAKMLSQVKDGWTFDTRRQLLNWLITARQFRGGKLLPDIMRHIRVNVFKSLSDSDREELKTEIARLSLPLTKPEPTPQLPIIQRWKMADLLPELPQAEKPRSKDSARRALAAATCLKCHRIGDDGGLVGPDLTNVGRRFDTRALLESIIEPSKVVDPKYRHTVYELTDGKIVAGRPVGVNAKQIQIETDPTAGTMVTVRRDAIESSELSAASPMPSGLLDVLTKDEVLDLLAYLKFAAAPH